MHCTISTFGAAETNGAKAFWREAAQLARFSALEGI
jgi:hypothetical protein